MNTSFFQTESKISGDSIEDTEALRKMANEARAYVSSFNWCPTIKELFLTYGIGNVIAVFLAQFADKIAQKDEFLWVIVGDLPNAYLVVDRISTPANAIEVYCDLMSDWITAVREGADLSDKFPVGVEPNPENAMALEKRVAFLRERIIPSMK